jgi:hypothetical protein
VRLKNEEDVRRRAIRAMQERSARRTGQAGAGGGGGAAGSSSVTSMSGGAGGNSAYAQHVRARDAGGSSARNGALGGGALAANGSGGGATREEVDAAIQFVTGGFARPLPQRDEDVAVDLLLRKDEKLLTMYRNFHHDAPRFQRLLTNYLRSL